MANVKNRADYEEAKTRIQRVVRDAVKSLKAGKVPLEHLEYQVGIHEDPAEKAGEKAIHQPYQCAIQLIDSGKPVRRGDTLHFVKVKPFKHGERTFTVKPKEHVEAFHEVNVDDYVRNLRTALNQTFKPMNISFREDEERKVTLTDFI